MEFPWLQAVIAVGIILMAACGNIVVGLLLGAALLALGLWKWSAPRSEHAGKVRAIIIYPLKSARGVQVSSAVLDSRGLQFDRLWMVVDERGAFMSQRRAPRLALVEAELPTSRQDPLRLRAPGAPPLEVPVVCSQRRPVRVWDDRNVGAEDQGDAAAAWLASVLGVEGVRLVRMADDVDRACSRKYAPRGSTTTFTDGFPLLLASDASLAEVNERLGARGKTAIPMDRFRPNLVIAADAEQGGPSMGGAAARPFAEDGWASICVRGAGGGASFGVVKPCARCKMPTIDQSTAVPDGRGSAAATVGADDDDEGGGPTSEAEPTATLRTFRTGALLGYKKAGWASDVFFGQNLVLHSAPGAVISVGDTVHATPRRPTSLLVRGVAGVDY